MDNIKIRDRGLFVDYQPTKLHKDVIYFAVDTCQLLLNGKLYGDKVLVVKAINVNDKTLSGFPAKITFDLGSDDYNKIFKSNSLETLIVLFDNPITEYELTHLFFRHLKDESFESEYKKIWTLDSPFFTDQSIRGELITYPTYMNCELNFDTSEDYKALHKLQNQINSESSIIQDKWTAKEGSNYTNDSKDITTAIYDLDQALKTEETARIKEDKILTDKYEELKEYTDNIKEPHVIKITSIPTTITDATIKQEIIDAYNKECPIFVEYTSGSNVTFFRADIFITNSGILQSFRASVVNTPNSRTDTMPDSQEIYAIKANLTSNVSITQELTRLNEVKNKVDKIPGKGLSEEDFTHTYREKLDELIEGKLLIDLANTTTAKTKLNQALGQLTANETNPVQKFNRWNYIYNSKYEVSPTISNIANRPEITTPDKCEYKVTSLSYTNGNWTLIGASTVHEKGNRFYSTISYTQSNNNLTIEFHEITPKSIGLGNVDNTSDKDKPVSDAVNTLVQNTKTELNTAITNEVNRAKGQEDKIEAAVGLNADGTHKKTTGNYTNTATTIAGEISALDTQVKKNQDAITKLNADASTTGSVANSIKTSIEALDVSDTAVSGQYVSSVSETDGKIKVSRGTIAASPLNSYSKGTSAASVTASDTINTAISKLENQVDSTKNSINNLDYADTSVSNQFVTSVSQTNGLIEVKRARPTASNISNTAITASDTQVGLSGTDIQTTIGNIATAIKNEEKARISSDNTLQSNINSIKGTIDNYTVNSKKISTNPVLNGADIKATNYTKPSTTGAIAATDTINQALGKLEKKADDHIANKSNPHSVTKSQVGLGNVNNTSDADKPVSTAQAAAIADAKKAGTDAQANLTSHINNKSNPHAVTKVQVGLGNVTNESKATMFTNPAFTGTPTAPTAATNTNNTQIATTQFVQTAIDTKLAANDAMLFKGTIGTGGTVTALPNTHNAGWTYKVITAGTYAGIACEVGDMIICIKDGTTANNAHWTVVQTNIDGAVTGPSSSTDNHIATFNGATGKTIKDSGVTASSGNITATKYVKSGGTSAQFLKADGSVDSNTYATTAKLTDGSVTKVGTATVGGTAKGIYLKAGTPTALSATVGSASLPVYLNAGTVTACTASSLFSTLSSSATTNLSVTVGGQNRTIANLYARYLANNFTSRQASMNVCYGDGTLRHFVATSSTTTGKPSIDSNILHMSWDNAGGYDAQLAIPTSNTGHVQWRNMTGKDTNGNYIYNSWNTLANLTDNVASATKLQTARAINGTSFDGTANITTANWGTARNIYIADSTSAHTGAAVSVNGSGNATLKLPATITAALVGNASSATKLATARSIFGKSFDGTADIAGQGLFYGSYNSDASVRYMRSSLQIRENGLVGKDQSDIAYAPSIGFHWSSKTAATMLLHSDGNFYFRKIDGVTRASLDANIIGNASTASKWATARTLTLTGSVTGSVSIDGGSNVTLTATTNHSHTFASLTSKPTTLSGYGITDAYTKTGSDNRYVKKSGDTMTGVLIVSTGNDRKFILDNTDDEENYNYIEFRQKGTATHTLGLRGSSSLKWDSNIIWHAGNDGSDSGLDADLLDGKHNGYVTAVSMTHKGFTNASEINYDTTMWTSNGDCPDVPILSYKSGITIGNSFSRAWQLFSSRGDAHVYYRNSKEDMSGWNTDIKKIAFTSDNVASADKWHTARAIGIVNSDGTGSAVVVNVDGSINTNLRLPSTIKASLTGNASTATTLQTTRTIWGQNFNGSANVSGSISSTSTITPASNNAADIGSSSLQYRYGYFSWVGNYTNSLSIGAANGYDINITSEHKVGIGTTSPTYKLQIAGNVLSTSYYNRDTFTGTSWANGYGAYNVAITDNNSQTPLMVAYRAGQSPAVTGANRLLSIEFLNSGSLLRYYFGGTQKFEFSSGGVLTASQFKKSGGTSSQFLKADGSVDSNSYALASSLSSYLKVDGSNGTAAGVNALVNKLSTATSTVTDALYFVTSNIDPTASINYYRRPASALWSYIKSKADGVYQPKGSYLTGITKAQVEAVLTGDITSHTHSQYLTTHQSLANYVTLNTQQTISGRKTFANVSLFNFYATSNNHAAIIINKSGTNYFGMGGNGVSNVIQMAMCSATGEWLLSDTSLTLKVIGSVQANSIVKIGGTSSQFLKADGSVDSNTYLTSHQSLANYYTKTEAGNTFAAKSHTHNYLVSEYSGNGGLITSSAIGNNRLWCKMSAQAGNGYQDWLYMNAYGGSDVPYNTAIGVTKAATPTAYIMTAPKTSTNTADWVVKRLLTTNDLKNLSKGTTSGSGNAVTDISVSGHTITLTKGSTFLTAHQSLANYLKVDGSNGTSTGVANLLSKLTSKTSISDTTKLLINSDSAGWITLSEFVSQLTTDKLNDVYLRLSGGTMNGTINSSVKTESHLNGNKGIAIINSKAPAGSYTMLAKMNSTNGYFTLGNYGQNFILNYTAKSTVDAGTNSTTTGITLLNEVGGTRLNSLTVGSSTESNTQVGRGYMELFSPTPFIDFHYGNSTEDYTSRIIESGSGLLSINSTIWANYGGNVGIGTTTPTAKLHVHGTITSNNTITGNKFVKSGGTSSQFLKADGSVDSNSYVTSSALSTTTTTANDALKLAQKGDNEHPIVLISGKISLGNYESSSSYSFTGIKHSYITYLDITTTEGLMCITPTMLSGHGCTFFSIQVTQELCRHEMTVSGTALIRSITTTSMSANNIGAHWFEAFIYGSKLCVREFHQSNGHNDEWSSNNWSGNGVRSINITVYGCAY